MLKSGSCSQRLQAGKLCNIFVLAVMLAAAAVLVGCGGSAHPNYTAPTTSNPGGGVSLVSIAIAPKTSLIGLGENRQLQAVGTYSNGTQANISAQVTWAATSGTSTTNNVSVNSSGVASGVAIGQTVITATLGGVVGVIPLNVDTNGYTTSTLAVLSVPYKSGVIDAAYIPAAQSKVQGAYAVQEVNLDADGFSTVLPVPVALLATIPMPSGYLPSAAIGIQSSYQVAVISYTSPNVQIIDAANLSTDLMNNMVVSTFISPITQSVTINGISCMICAGVYDPTTAKVILSTSQGFYAMDPVAGTFTAIPFTPAPAPAANFSLNPVATPDPYILSASASTGEVQELDLTTNVVTTIPNTGLTAPTGTAIDLISNAAALTDSASLTETVADLTTPQAPPLTPYSPLGICTGSPSYMNMAAMGIGLVSQVSTINGYLLTSQTAGTCAGIQLFPATSQTGQPVFYGYAPMPNTPPTPTNANGTTFINGPDPNAIATFNDVISSSFNSYGLLASADGQWLGRINLGNLEGLLVNGGTYQNSPLPMGSLIDSQTFCATGTNAPLCGNPGPIVYLPTPAVAIIVSVPNLDFGSVNVGTPSGILSVIETNIDTSLSAILNNTIAVTGPNANDFALTYTCGLQINPSSTCTVNVTFTPSTKAAETATLTFTVSGEANPVTVALTGTGM